ncbi:MAG: hypothetical protein ACKPKO_59840, partial [Candidatus Fonsibacter sp.]
RRAGRAGGREHTHYGPKVTEQIFLKATTEPYSFLWLNLSAKNPEDLSWLRFEARIIPRSSSAR